MDNERCPATARAVQRMQCWLRHIQVPVPHATRHRPSMCSLVNTNLDSFAAGVVVKPCRDEWVSHLLIEGLAPQRLLGNRPVELLNVA